MRTASYAVTKSTLHVRNALCLRSGHPVKVPLPGPAQQVACGDNHTVVLLQSGTRMYTMCMSLVHLYIHVHVNLKARQR